MTTSLFQRSAGPILVPDISIPWASGAVFNPGIWFENGITHMLFRAIPTGYSRFDLVDPTSKVQLTGFDNYVSSIGYASSRDGVHFD